MDTQRNYKLILNKLSYKLTKLNYKLIVKQIFELGVMITLTVFAVSYANQAFEIPFFPRDAETNIVAIDITRNTTVRPTTTEAPTEMPTNVMRVINPEALVADGEPDEQNNGEDFDSLADLAALGFAVSDGVYEPYDEERIEERKAEIRQMRADFSSAPALYEYRFARITPQHTPANTLRAVEPFMDYLLIRDGVTRVVLADASGRTIDSNFANSELEILKMRDWEGRTVFRKRDIVETDDGPIVETAYFIYNAESVVYEQIDFNEAWGNRGADFMYPSYYGAPNNNLEIFRHTDGRWGFRAAEDGRHVIAPHYNRAFNFSENIAAAYTTDWTEWRQIGSQLYFFDDTGMIINSSFYAPDPIDEDTNHLGFYYFDHGLTRVIEKRIDAWRISTIEQREFLVDTNWREFYTPVDYKIRAYSNGMILLEKDGNFGFMNYLGEWIAQPIYTYAEPFFEGVAVLGMTDGKKMLIDTQGNIIAKMQYDHISNCTGGIIALYERGAGWTILNKVRREIPVD